MEQTHSKNRCTLAQYGDYHRDRRNVLTHLIGIPMIVVALITLLSRPDFAVAYLLLTPANLVVLAVIFYIRLDIKLGLLVTVRLWLCLSLGHDIAIQHDLHGLSIGSFVVGWVFQFIGHYFYVINRRLWTILWAWLLVLCLSWPKSFLC